MNTPTSPDQAAVRAEIDSTRRRMDGTLEALSDRLQPRHLLDEALGYLRGNGGEGESRLHRLGETLGRSTGQAVHTVTDAIKSNPVPALLIGSGIAWLIYEGSRDKSAVRSTRRAAGRRGKASESYDPDMHYDGPLDYPSTLGATTDDDWSGSITSPSSGAQSEADHPESGNERRNKPGSGMREKITGLGDRAGEKLHQMKERASELTDKVRDGTREIYDQTRERVGRTADEHPLELGLAVLAAGLVVGLVLPTPNAVHRTVGPAADRLRGRAREAGLDMMERGKQVARAAGNAAKQEAEAQGLTAEQLRAKLGTSPAKSAPPVAAGSTPLDVPSSEGPTGQAPTLPRAFRPAENQP